MSVVPCVFGKNSGSVPWSERGVGEEEMDVYDLRVDGCWVVYQTGETKMEWCIRILERAFGSGDANRGGFAKCPKSFTIASWLCGIRHGMLDGLSSNVSSGHNAKMYTAALGPSYMPPAICNPHATYYTYRCFCLLSTYERTFIWKIQCSRVPWWWSRSLWHSLVSRVRQQAAGDFRWGELPNLLTDLSVHILNKIHFSSTPLLIHLLVQQPLALDTLPSWIILLLIRRTVCHTVHVLTILITCFHPLQPLIIAAGTLYYHFTYLNNHLSTNSVYIWQLLLWSNFIIMYQLSISGY